MLSNWILGEKPILCCLALIFALDCSGKKTLAAMEINQPEEAIVFSKTGVIIYAAPQVTAKKIGRLVIGEKVKILQKQQEPAVFDFIYDYWFRIRHHSVEGWVFGGGLFKTKSAETGGVEIYENEAEGIRPILIISKSGEFFLRQNECQGILDITGKYTYHQGKYRMVMAPIQELTAETHLSLRQEGSVLIVEEELLIKHLRYGNYRSICAPLLNSAFKKIYGKL